MKLTGSNIVYTGVTAIGVSASSGQNISVIPVDTHLNPVNIWGQIIDGGVSTYALQYTTADVYSPGFSAATASNWTAVPSAPTTGTAPFNITGLGATGLRLNVTVGPATVTLGPVFQSDNTLGA